MKTDITKKAAKQSLLAFRRAAHHKALEELRDPKCKNTGLQIWRKLRKTECALQKQALRWCNDPTFVTEDWENVKEQAKRDVISSFGWLPTGLFINSDPRGHSLKLDNEKIALPESLHRDMGGYGILAPVID